jgi:hypothetical protein
VLLAVLAVLAGSPTASASDATCPTAGEPEPVTGEVVIARWHGGAGFTERCTSATGTRAAEPAAEPSAAAAPVAEGAAAAPPSQAAAPAPKATKAKKAKAKRKSKRARARVRAKCLHPR